MKKFILLLIAIFLVGCQKQSTSIYDEMINNIKESTDYKNKSSYFSVTYYLTQLNERTYRYDIIIDSPTVEMENIRAVAITEDDGTSIFPSIGYKEGEVYHMDLGEVNKLENYVKGILLSGDTYCNDGTIKLYVEFTSDNELFKEYILIDSEMLENAN